MTAKGVYVGNNVNEVKAFEAWAGDQVDYIAAYTGRANWADWNGSVGWIADQFDQLDRPLRWSIPMFPLEGNLKEAASGAYNSHYLNAAKTLLADRPQDAKILVRIGEEFNGNWMPWAAKGKETDFIGAYRQFVDTFRSVSDKFQFEWNVNIDNYPGNTTMSDPVAAYPGDAWVDVIGMDFYYDKAYYSSDPLVAWETMKNQHFGLQWLENFAAQHGKPSAYSEWGVNTNTAGPYVQKAFDWFESQGALYQIYWDSNADFAGKLSNGQYPATSAVYKAEFAESGSVDTPPPPPPPDMSGDNLLDGTGSTASLAGGLGNDTYIADASNEVIVERAGQGTDTVRSSASFVLPANVENLILTGNLAVNGTGNGLNNAITGNAGNNTLRGEAGNDTLLGLDGNDVLVDGAGNDTIDGGTGTDRHVFTSIPRYGQEVNTVYGRHSTEIVDVSALDANVFAAGNQAFVRVGSFTGKSGQVTTGYNASTNLTTVQFDNDGDRAADLIINLAYDASSSTNWIY